MTLHRCSNCEEDLSEDQEICPYCENKIIKRKKIIEPKFLGKLFLLLLIIYIVVIKPLIKSIS